MDTFVCTQDRVLPDTCLHCGGWLHAQQRGGFPGRAGCYCSEDCAADFTLSLLEQNTDNHLALRDPLCGCRTCTEAGHPTPSEVAEHDAYLTALPGHLRP